MIIIISMVAEYTHITQGAPQDEYSTHKETEFPVFVNTVNPAQFSALDRANAENQGQPLDAYDESDSEEDDDDEESGTPAPAANA